MSAAPDGFCRALLVQKRVHLSNEFGHSEQGRTGSELDYCVIQAIRHDKPELALKIEKMPQGTDQPS